MGYVGGQFPHCLGEESRGLHEILFCEESLHGEIEPRSLCFALYLFIYLFIICLFIVCLFAFYLLIRSCLLGHASIRWEREGGIGGGYFYVVMWQFWWVSSELFCSPVGLMQDVMESLLSFLTSCYYCLQLFIIKYSFCV